jgi:hypothetical protein
VRDHERLFHTVHHRLNLECLVHAALRLNV